MVRFDGFVLQEWFVTNKKASMKLKKQPRETVHQAKQHVMDHHHHHHHPHYQMQHHLTLRRTPVERPGGPVWLADDEQAPIEMEDADKNGGGEPKGARGEAEGRLAAMSPTRTGASVQSEMLGWDGVPRAGLQKTKTGLKIFR